LVTEREWPQSGIGMPLVGFEVPLWKSPLLGSQITRDFVVAYLTTQRRRFNGISAPFSWVLGLLSPLRSSRRTEQTSSKGLVIQLQKPL
jgi:hypothetical protein